MGVSLCPPPPPFIASRISAGREPANCSLLTRSFLSPSPFLSQIETFVDFPIHGLDLSPYVLHQPAGASAVYDLFAVSNHFGGLGGGHYTAFCYNQDQASWYQFDDSRTERVSEASIKTAAAYVLFYRSPTAHRT